MLLRNPFAGAFGINIGDLSIKLVQILPCPFYKRCGYVLKEIRSASIPPGLIVDGEIQQPEPVRQKLLFLLGRGDHKYKPIKSTWVVASLPETKTFLKLIEVEIDGTDLSSVDIAYQAKKHLPFELEETYLDWQIVNTDTKENTAQILIGAVPKVIADSYTFLLESAGLNPIALEIEAISIARSMITEDKDYTGEARALLDLGGTRSSLLIYDNKSIQFSTTLKFSGELVTSAVELGLKLERHQAEVLKINNGLAFDQKNPKYLPIVSKLAENLIEEIKTNFLFYKEHFKNPNKINHITMCGGMSNWKGIDNLVSRKLKIATHPGHPWKNLFNRGLYSFDQEKSLGFASSIGLALKAAKNPFEDGTKTIR
ncbi:MAG: pilus assembly protein PilM [Patescibacteria group bacterium]